MTWQEDEIKKRRSEQKDSAERERRRAIRASHVEELWRQFLDINKNLTRELQLAVSRKYTEDGKNYIESMIAANYDNILNPQGMISFDSRRGIISYKQPEYCAGGPPQITEYAVLYNEDDNYYFTCDAYDVIRQDVGEELVYSRYLIDGQAMNVIIRNLCTGERRLTEGLQVMRQVADPAPPKRKKLFGIF